MLEVGPWTGQLPDQMMILDNVATVGTWTDLFSWFGRPGSGKSIAPRPVTETPNPDLLSVQGLDNRPGIQFMSYDDTATEDAILKIMEAVGKAKSMGNRGRLGLGRHVVILDNYYYKASAKEDAPEATRMIADIVVAESTTETVGALRENPWFILAKGYGKKYEQDRNKQFLKVIIDTIGEDAVKTVLKGINVNADTIDSEDTLITKFGVAMLKKAQPLRGVALVAEVGPGNKIDPKTGQPYSQVTWSVHSKQSLEDIATNRAELGGDPAPAVETKAPAQTASTPAVAATAPATGAKAFSFGARK